MPLKTRRPAGSAVPSPAWTACASSRARCATPPTSCRPAPSTWRWCAPRTPAPASSRWRRARRAAWRAWRRWWTAPRRKPCAPPCRWCCPCRSRTPAARYPPARCSAAPSPPGSPASPASRWRPWWPRAARRRRRRPSAWRCATRSWRRCATPRPPSPRRRRWCTRAGLPTSSPPTACAPATPRRRSARRRTWCAARWRSVPPPPRRWSRSATSATGRRTPAA